MHTRPVLLVLVVALALAGCSTASPQEVQGRVGAMPGVVSAIAGSVGDDDLPFGRGDVYVSVEMAADATADQVAAVLVEVDGDLGEEHVESIEVRMAGPKLATLTTGGGVHESEQLARDLVTAYGDGEVLTYQHEGSYVVVRLATADFDDVVAAADRYGGAGDPDQVSVVAGPFRLERDRADDDPSLTVARTRFVQLFDDELPLTGAVVSSGRPLELWTDGKHRDALRTLLAEDPEAQGLGTVVVRSRGIPWS